MKTALLYISLIANLLVVVAVLIALNRFGGWRNLWAKINSRGIEPTYFHRKNLFEMLPARDSAIVFLGNSITAHGEWAELLDNERAVNRGISGDHCDGVRERLDEVVKLRPQILFLLIGVNDLAFHPPEVVLGKYERLLADILKKMPATKVYLQTLFPVNNNVSPTPVSNAAIKELNVGIRQLAADNQLKIIDLHPLLQDANGNLDAKYTLDGLHINGLAYTKWAVFIADRINDAPLTPDS